MSYVHLRFLLDHFAGQDLRSLWTVAGSLTRSKSAVAYWEAIDTTICQLLGEGESALRDYRVQAITKTKELGQEGIDFWNARIEVYRKLSQEEAIAQLIKAKKIEQKIQTIRRAVNIPLPG